MIETQPVIGSIAPDFKLATADGQEFHLAEACRKKPVVLVFYPGDFTPVCTKQLCNYQENYGQFNQWNVQVLGLSKDSPDKHQAFIQKYGFSFPLVTDEKNKVGKAYGCTSNYLLGMVSRAICIVGTDQKLLYRYVEPLAVTRRTSEDIFKVLEELKAKKLI
jgi:thioredoxin-dependent peroxiredoxin